MKVSKITLLISICAIMFACSTTSNDLISGNDTPQNANDLLCVEFEAATLFSMFSGKTHVKLVRVPENLTDLSEKTLMDFSARCLNDGEDALLLDTIRALRSNGE